MFANIFAIELNAFAEGNEVWRSEQADAQSARAINTFEHGARGAFAVGAGNVDEAKAVVRIAGEFSELEGSLQSELRAEKTQVAEKLNGFGVGHRFKG